MRKFLLATTLALVPGFSFAQTTFNVRSYGATGDCVSDDSKYIAIAMKPALPADAFPVVYFPAGCYVLGSGATLPTLKRPVGIKGDGPGKTFIYVRSDYVGDVFSFSETWGNNNTGEWKPRNDFTKGSVRDLSIFGDLSAPTVQNGIALYDRNSEFLVENVTMRLLTGKCLSIGTKKAITQAWTIESNFINLRCFDTAGVDVSSWTASGSDASNELKFVNLDIFRSSGTGLQFRNPNNFSATRLIDCINCRVENSTGDNIVVGSPSDAGRVASVHFVNLQSISPGQTNAGHYGLVIDTAGQQAYDISVTGGVIGPCSSGTICNGVNIGKVSSGRVRLGNISVTGTGITYQTTVGDNVILDGGGLEKVWTYSIPQSVVSKVRTPAYFQGDPTTK